jgi:PIN domain nuclease of toxin-antitoxin system
VSLLLDTHVFLWLHTDRSRIPAVVLDALADPDRPLHLSVGSAWEMGIKNGIGKLPLPDDLAVWLSSRMLASGVAPLAATLAHVLAASALPTHHRDPFDRLLVAQAQIEDLTIVTRDPQVSAYDVDILWG